MEDLPELLRRFWGLDGAAVTPLGGGMNSETWLVASGSATYVAKRVPPSQVTDLVTGCDVASTLADSGLVTGRPVRTADARLVVGEHGLALLEYVPGRELAGEADEDQPRMGATLADAHAAGQPALGPSPATFMTRWLSPRLPGVAHHPWLLRAIDAVRAETNPLRLTWSLLHTDPAPEAFVHDESTGVTGLIDWAGSTRGPVLYDVASAVMYLGGADRATTFLDAYRAAGPLGPEELQLVDVFARFRWAVQGAYFAWRSAGENLVGVAGQADNHVGLDRARKGLDDLGLREVR